jgi:hypothetical protein
MCLLGVPDILRSSLKQVALLSAIEAAAIVEAHFDQPEPMCNLGQATLVCEHADGHLLPLRRIGSIARVIIHGVVLRLVEV